MRSRPCGGPVATRIAQPGVSTMFARCHRGPKRCGGWPVCPANKSTRSSIGATATGVALASAPTRSTGRPWPERVACKVSCGPSAIVCARTRACGSGHARRLVRTEGTISPAGVPTTSDVPSRVTRLSSGFGKAGCTSSVPARSLIGRRAKVWRKARPTSRVARCGPGRVVRTPSRVCAGRCDRWIELRSPRDCRISTRCRAHPG